MLHTYNADGFDLLKVLDMVKSDEVDSANTMEEVRGAGMMSNLIRTTNWAMFCTKLPHSSDASQKGWSRPIIPYCPKRKLCMIINYQLFLRSV
jgi:hypothetical protein